MAVDGDVVVVLAQQDAVGQGGFAAVCLGQRDVDHCLGAGAGPAGDKTGVQQQFAGVIPLWVQLF